MKNNHTIQEYLKQDPTQVFHLDQRHFLVV